MSKRRRSEQEFGPPPGPQTAAAAVLEQDPPESTPPTATELGFPDDWDGPENDGDTETGRRGDTETADTASSLPASPAPRVPVSSSSAPDCSQIVANLDRPSAPAWPTSSPFQVDWPWGDERDPVPGDPQGNDIVGWNWQRGEICVVTAVPPYTVSWPYTLTVEVRPMPPAWRRARVFDLQSGKDVAVEWYTRWDRATNAGGGWLGVVQESGT